jgi:hypothetical protein
MGNPAVVFTTYSINSSTSWATTNVSGHAANSTSSPFVELKSDKVPQAALFSNGDYSVADFDTIRTTAVQNSVNSEGSVIGTHRNTSYSTRGTLGTFALSGGQFELCEFDTGVKGSSIADHASKSGVSHNYVAFANTGDGDGLTRHANGNLNVTASVVVGPPTAYAPGKPFANIEYDVAHTSTPLQAIAGGGTREALSEPDSGGVDYPSIYIGSVGNTITNHSNGDYASTAYWWTINNTGGRTQATISRPLKFEETPAATDDVPFPLSTIRVYANSTNAILENWYPQADYSLSEVSSSVHQGTIKFRVHPDSEYVMSENMTTTNVAVASVTIAPSGDVGPIATHSKVTVTTDDDHGLADDQNQIVMSGSDNPTHINGIHNVYSVTSDTVFTYEIIKSTAPAGETCEGTFKLQTYDGIDKTGAVIKTGVSAAGIAEVVHGGCGGNNTVLLRGDTSSNISLRTQYYAYANNTSTASIASVNFTNGPTYKSMFKEMGLVLDRDTGQISSNGVFAGGTSINTITAGGFITLEENVTGKPYGTEFVVHEDGFGGKMETEDFARSITFPDSGLNELDSYFPKFKHARDYAQTRVKTDGTITQSEDVVTLIGADVTNHLVLENEDTLFTENHSNTAASEMGYFIIGLEDGTKTFPTKYAENLPAPARFISLKYQNGFSTNVSYATSNTEFIVQSNAEIGFTEGTVDGESYELTYTDTSWPTTNGSSYWFMNNVDNAPVVNDQSEILIFKTTSEGTNFKVHFTIQAQKVHEHMGVYTGAQGTSTAASVLNTIDGFGNFETGTGNYKDGYFYVSIYNSTDSDRDDQVVVFSDQNNASSSTLDFNGNAFKHRDDPDDPDTEISILNEEALANAYSNGDFTLLTSV